ncbi:MAG: type IV pilus twitching motility protein PilT [Elusimicrobia bacterium]|nr:type IV pilus twitching motility protein PilT [Elusimicrobiota bacterium]
MELVEILKAAVGQGASDVHLTTGSVPLVRVHGEIQDLAGFSTLNADDCRRMIYSILYEEQRAKFEAHMELDCSVQIPNMARFRVNVLRQRGSVEAVLRVISSTIPTPEQIGLGPKALSMADLGSGLVLVTGPTGSGKSTTLACLIDRINQTSNKHILTVEDPIEYLYTRSKCVIRQREVGSDTESFQAALRHALRQDPDVILVGELRDLETIQLALTAAETGHLCLATLHTRDAASTVDRIIDVFPAHQQQQIRVQLAGSLKGVITQLLAPRADGQGMVAVREMMFATPALANLIREGKTHMIRNVIETSGKDGMFTMDKSIEELVQRGTITREEAEAMGFTGQKKLR